MTSADMSARTQSMTASTASFAPQPSRITLAARSMRRVDRIENVEERRAAFAQHMDQYPPVISSY